MVAQIDISRWGQGLALGGLCAVVGLIAGFEPLVAITIALSLGLVAVTVASLSTGLVIFIVVVFCEFVLPVVAGLSFTKAIGFLLAASWLAKVATESSQRNFITAYPTATALLVAFMAWATLSMLWAADTAASLTDLGRYLLNFGLVVIIFSAVASPRTARIVFGTFVAGCALTSVYALVFRPTTELDPLRIISTVGNPNILASILVAGFIVSAAGVLAFRAPAARIGSALTALLCLITLFPTGSRSGVIALAAALATVVLVAGRRRPQAAVGAGLLAVTITIGFLALAPDHLRERIASAAPGQTEVTEGRTTLWQVGWEMTQDEPVRGFGVGNFAASSGDYAFIPGLAPQSQFVIDDPQVAHNIYLQILVELGIVGLILFLAIIGFALRCALLAAGRFERAGEVGLELLSRSLVPAVVAILVSDFFASEQFNKLLWLLVGLGPAMLGIATGLKPATEEIPRQLDEASA